MSLFQEPLQSTPDTVQSRKGHVQCIPKVNENREVGYGSSSDQPISINRESSKPKLKPFTEQNTTKPDVFVAK